MVNFGSEPLCRWIVRAPDEHFPLHEPVVENVGRQPRGRCLRQPGFSCRTHGFCDIIRGEDTLK